jgi:uroporphyrinogen decarboxylase
MTSKERFVNTLRFRPVDRVPNLEIGVWAQTRDRWLQEGAPAEAFTDVFLKGNAHFGLDGCEGTTLNPTGPIPPFEYQVLSETPEDLVFRDTMGRVRHGLKVDGKYTSICMDHYLEFPVKDRASFLEMRRRYEGPVEARYPQDWPAFVERSRGLDKPLGINNIYGDFGFYSMLRTWIGTEPLSYLFYDDPALVHECLQFLEDHILRLYARALSEVRFDYVIIHEDLAGKGGPLLGPKLFREFILPHYQRYLEFLRAGGIRVVIVDTDGDFEALIPVFLDAGVDGFNPMEVAAGMDPVRLRARYGRSFSMVGGVDKREIAKDRAAIDREVARIAPLVAEGGYIPWIDHTVPPDTPLANFEYYLEQKRRILCGG